MPSGVKEGPRAQVSLSSPFVTDAARLKDGLSYSNRETDSAVSSSSSNLSDPRNSSGPRLTQVRFPPLEYRRL